MLSTNKIMNKTNLGTTKYAMVWLETTKILEPETLTEAERLESIWRALSTENRNSIAPCGPRSVPHANTIHGVFKLFAVILWERDSYILK